MRPFSTPFAKIALLAAPLLAAPAAAGAAVPDADAEAWRGRICTPLGCERPGTAPWTRTAGFGAAVLAALWVSRRQSVER